MHTIAEADTLPVMVLLKKPCCQRQSRSHCWKSLVSSFPPATTTSARAATRSRHATMVNNCVTISIIPEYDV